MVLPTLAAEGEEMNIQQHKEIAKEILAKLQTLDSRAILAGGAVRDWFFNKEAKDLDFYVDMGAFPSGTSSDLHGTLKRVLEEVLGVELVSLRSADGNPYLDENDEAGEGLKEVLEGSFQDCHIQIMLYEGKPLDYVIKYFNTSICQCYWEGGNKLPKYLSHFIASVGNKIITYKKGMLDSYHVAKMKGYFPEYTFVEGVKCKQGGVYSTERLLTVFTHKDSSYIGEEGLVESIPY
jgi:hypothetical protein